MPVEITRMVESDIDGAVDCIQKAFAEDPYFAWVFPENFSPVRNRVSLTIRCRWGLEHALFYVAKDPSSPTPSRVLGVACWLPPTNPSAPQSWKSWFGDWSLWLNQIWMNSVYGRGGLNVRRYYIWFVFSARVMMFRLALIIGLVGKLLKATPSVSSGQMTKVTTFVIS
ncbi:hypothetical protein E4T48_03461 [Aureobasidium sp. EXF-10727]|nr:hypothetical protein E4T48_03461 [Aureobasidium sp. EXF-10727]